MKKSQYDASANQILLARIGSKLMDISATTKMKGLSNEEIGRTNRMSSFGDALTRFGTTFGPQTLEDVLRISGTTQSEAAEFMKIGYSN
jgi:hypothetical protein